MEKGRLMTHLKNYLGITVVCIPYALAFNCFYDANDLTCGGFTGIAQILNHFLPLIPVGTLALLLNLPLFVLGWRRFGGRFLFTTIYAVTVSSIFIDLMAAVYTFPPIDPLLASLYGGVLLGVSVGLLFKFDATTGGTELGARLLLRYVPHLHIGRVCMMIDFVVISVYSAVFNSVLNALYGGVALYMTTKVMDLVIYGGREAKVAYIISRHNDVISEALLAAGLGVTILPAKGAWTKEEHPVLLVAIRRREITGVKRIVNELDGKAFLIVCDAREVLGEGFGQYQEDGL